MFFNTTIRVYPDASGQFKELPGLAREGEVLEILIEYLLSLSDTASLQTMIKIREAVSLFIYYTEANWPDATFGKPLPSKVKPWKHFQNFASALLNGTINAETGIDPSRLGWAPSNSRKVNRVTRILTEFFDWTSDPRRFGLGNLFNPETVATRHEQIMLHAAYEHRRSRNMLGHIWNAETQKVNGRLLKRAKESRSLKGKPPRFPDDLFKQFLHHGFCINGVHNLRDILITLLLHGGGLRNSEPMHLYVSDVSFDPFTGGALIVIPHPEEGDAPFDSVLKGKNMMRREYLATRYQRRSRTKVMGREHAGWKSGVKKIEIVWFEPKFGQLFWTIWQQYLKQLLTVERDHPFAFVNFSSKDQFAGKPYTIASYEEAHKRAVFRSGIVNNDTVGLKSLGLTPHGHRHAYATRLTNSGVHTLLIMRWMNHRSEESQKVYTQKDNEEMRTEVAKGLANMKNQIDFEGLVWG